MRSLSVFICEISSSLCMCIKENHFILNVSDIIHHQTMNGWQDQRNSEATRSSMKEGNSVFVCEIERGREGESVQIDVISCVTVMC